MKSWGMKCRTTNNSSGTMTFTTAGREKALLAPILVIIIIDKCFINKHNILLDMSVYCLVKYIICIIGIINIDIILLVPS